MCAALQRAQKGEFRVIEYSVQDDHLHMIVEANDGAALSSGAHGLAIRLARAINRTLDRSGRVFGDRYHTRTLRTPREVRFCLVYVLHNFRKHQPQAMTVLDPCSSAVWFDGYRGGSVQTVDGAAPTRVPRTWLLRVGWRRYGLLSPLEQPTLRDAPS